MLVILSIILFMEISTTILSLKIPRNAQLMLAFLVKNYGARGHVSTSEIVTALGVSRKTVYNCANKLAAMGIIQYRNGLFTVDIDNICDEYPDLWNETLNASNNA